MLEKLYNQLSELESKELFCIDSNLFDKVKDIRKEMIPIKNKINEIEECIIYEHINICDLDTKNSPAYCAHLSCEHYCIYEGSCSYRLEGEK